MDHEKQLKLQSFLDEELSEAEAREVASWLAQDQEATLLLAELRNTRQSLARFEAGIRVPETREFYWSKIKREIERLEPAPRTERKPSWLESWRRILIPGCAVAVVLLASLIALNPSRGPEAESVYNDPGTFTYHDYEAQTTLVWLSYPAENELADEGQDAKVP